MAKARRAKARPSRVVVPVVVAVAAVAAVVAWQVVPHSDATRAGSPEGVTAGAGPSPGPSSSVSASPSGDPAAAELRSCRERVDRADAVLAAARTGVGHWSEHVQAQTDANRGVVTVAEMDAVFARTRLAGPDDQDGYRKALDDYDDADGSCRAVPGASSRTAAALTDCRNRASAQRPVLEAADDAMGDWKNHLAAMKRSRTHQMDDAEQIWVAAWRAAPPHIEAYDEAAKAFRKAPDC